MRKCRFCNQVMSKEDEGNFYKEEEVAFEIIKEGLEDQNIGLIKKLRVELEKFDIWCGLVKEATDC